MKNTIRERKEIDEALWGFGKNLEPKKKGCI
jgi:hypothetical protein